jgi:hypothetical protein
MAPGAGSHSGYSTESRFIHPKRAGCNLARLSGARASSAPRNLTVKLDFALTLFVLAKRSKR